LNEAVGHHARSLSWTAKQLGSASPFNFIPLILTFSQPGEGTFVQRIVADTRLATQYSGLKSKRWTASMKRMVRVRERITTELDVAPPLKKRTPRR